jgi:hypothetical protein
MDCKGEEVFGSTDTGEYPIVPMFGHFMFMPVTKEKSDSGILLNQQFSVVEAVSRVKREYNRRLNCFFDQVNRSTARDYIKPVDEAYDWNAKRNAAYHAIEDPSHIDNQAPERAHPTYKNRKNAFFEYQLFMAQQLQYFSVHGCKNIFDPLVRS